MNQELNIENDGPDETVRKYTWDYVRNLALQHRRHLIKAHVIALLAALVSVPVPLLMPLLVDEVLLHKP
ncbi:MAG: ABC transporter ATP-binding protein, partial [Gammaproteobacteria bacterium]|nr:ABC transporter ATP-binding protein [Gammaproteobacteria bacterium]